MSAVLMTEKRAQFALNISISWSCGSKADKSKKGKSKKKHIFREYGITVGEICCFFTVSDLIANLKALI